MQTTSMPPSYLMLPAGLKIILGLLAFAGLTIGQVILISPTWLAITYDQGIFRSLSVLRCLPKFTCTLGYSPFFGFALMLMLLGALLFHIALNNITEKMTLHPMHVMLPSLTFTQSRLRKWVYGLLAFVVFSFALLIYFAITSLGIPPWWLWLGCLFGLCALCAILDYATQRGLFSKKELSWGAGYLAILVIGGLLNHSATGQIISIVAAVGMCGIAGWRKWFDYADIGVWLLAAIGLTIYSINLTSWQFTFIGDEYAFYNVAKSILANPSKVNPMQLLGVYDTHPISASLFHATSMAVFGQDIYGWRLAETLAIYLALPLLYALANTIMSKRGSLISVILFASSHVLMGISKVGYNNVQSLIPIVGGLTFLALAARRGSWLGVALSGIVGTLGFYTFALAIPMMIVLAALYFVLFILPAPMRITQITGISDSPIRRFEQYEVKIRLLCATVFAIGVIAVAISAVSNPRWLANVQRSSIAQSEVKTTDPLTGQILPNIAYAYTLFLTSDRSTHYVSRTLTDPITSTLIVCGWLTLLLFALRHRMAAWLWIAMLLSAIVIGGLIPYAFPVNTRNFAFMPFWALIAAIPIERTLRALDFAKHQRFAQILKGISVSIILGAVLLNGQQHFVRMPQIYQYNGIALTVQLFQQFPQPSTLFLAQRPPLEDRNLFDVLDAYGLKPRQYFRAINENNPDVMPALIAATYGDVHIAIAMNSPQQARWQQAFQAIQPSGNLITTYTPKGDPAYLVFSTNGSASAPVLAEPAPIAQNAPKPIAPALIEAPLADGWRISIPKDVTVGQDGNIYVINGDRNIVEVFDKTGKRLRSITHNWVEPVALASAPDGDLLILDARGNPAITKINPDGSIKNTSSESMSTSRDIAIAPNGDVYVAETAGGRIVHFSPDLKLIRKLNFNRSIGQPAAIAVNDDHLFVIDGDRLIMSTIDGIVETKWQIGGYNTSQPPRILDMPINSIMLTNPEGGTVNIFDFSGKKLQTFRAGGVAEGAQFRKPLGLARRGTTLFIAENEGDAIRFFELTQP